MKFPKPMDVGPAKSPLRIAIVYGRIPLPMRRADQLTVAHLLSFLKARNHAVDLYCVNTGGVADEAERAWLNEACREVHLYDHGKSDIARALFGALRKLPTQVGLFSHPEQRRDVRQRISQGDYDVVYTYYFRSAEITRDTGRPAGTPPEVGDHRPATFLAMQLSQTLNTKRIAQNAPNLANRLFYAIESRLVAAYEARIWKHFTHSVLIGPRDVEEIANTCRMQGMPAIDNYIYGAHGTDVTRFAPRPDIAERKNHLVFSGVMRTPTNVHAVQWFAQNVWPKVRAVVPDATWTIVGREPTAEVQALGKLPGVNVAGTVTDPALFMAEAAICINSMQAGGGMQNKLIEYLAMGKAVVATPVANEGIGATSGQHLMEAGTPEAFADAVIALLGDDMLRAALGAAGRGFVLENWTWESHWLRLEDNFYRAVGFAAHHQGFEEK
ncbi:MAG: glycosyltransferase [Candidatus Andeanibacterium colombiense]|uniref:Glycosyltransferase n=1 Tax=Candidatus Andeanibacterium colombiense TaxID=3121345 RepID=A0AAJ5X763_9SPHN|nr:MAG: glycosyltransferase [Sphingomonadaceae bacterium]